MHPFFDVLFYAQKNALQQKRGMDYGEVTSRRQRVLSAQTS